MPLTRACEPCPGQALAETLRKLDEGFGIPAAEAAAAARVREITELERNTFDSLKGLASPPAAVWLTLQAHPNPHPHPNRNPHPRPNPHPNPTYIYY